MLRRTRIGRFTQADAVELDTLAASTQLMTMAEAASLSFPCIRVDAAAALEQRHLLLPLPQHRARRFRRALQRHAGHRGAARLALPLAADAAAVRALGYLTKRFSRSANP